MPILTALAIAGAVAAATSAGAGIAGAATSAGEEGNINAVNAANLQGEQQLISENSQTFPERQDLFGQLSNFYSPYLSQGSPFLAQQQRAGAEQNTLQYGNAAGQLKANLGQTGLGYGPSGTEASALGGLAGGAAQNASSNYLTNLLNNEQVKFQAAQGLQNTQGLISPVQQQPVNPTQIGATNPLASSLSSLGPQLSALIAQFPSLSGSSSTSGNQNTSTNSGQSNIQPLFSDPAPAGYNGSWG